MIKVASIKIDNCVQANLTFNGETRAVYCNESHYFAAPNVSGEIVVVSKNQTQKMSYTVSDFVSFEKTFFVMMFYPVTVQIVNPPANTVINSSDFVATVDSVSAPVNEGVFVFLPKQKFSNVSVTYHGLQVNKG